MPYNTRDPLRRLSAFRYIFMARTLFVVQHTGPLLFQKHLKFINFIFLNHNEFLCLLNNINNIFCKILFDVTHLLFVDEHLNFQHLSILMDLNGKYWYLHNYILHIINSQIYNIILILTLVYQNVCDIHFTICQTLLFSTK